MFVFFGELFSGGFGTAGWLAGCVYSSRPYVCFVFTTLASHPQPSIHAWLIRAMDSQPQPSMLAWLRLAQSCIFVSFLLLTVPFQKLRRFKYLKDPKSVGQASAVQGMPGRFWIF